MIPTRSGRGAAKSADSGEVLFEFSAVGNSVKVCAIDPVTMVEAVILGPAGTDEATLRQAAIQKLRYVLAKNGTVPNSK